MRVAMFPHAKNLHSRRDGISQVVDHYCKYLPHFGVEVVDKYDDSCDLRVAHAGCTGNECDVAILHGLYWSADYKATKAELAANKRIVEAVRSAKRVTVPSKWVCEPFQRDMRFTPDVVPHGIDWKLWQHKETNLGYVLWNKNRTSDACNPAWVTELSKNAKNIKFVSTFSGSVRPSNMHVTGVLQHEDMKKTIQRAGVYLSTTKETFGIGVLEALASGVPVLGFAHGGNLDLVQHKFNGYLVEPNNLEDLIEGMFYCIQHRPELSRNAIESAKHWTWESAIEKLVGVFEKALEPQESTVSVVIPLYNNAHRIKRTLESVLTQTYQAIEIVIVDDGSTDDPVSVLQPYIDSGVIEYIRKENSGVAHARNLGLQRATGRYLCCLDSDDAIAPTFLETCVRSMEDDRNIDLAYTGLKWVKPDGSTGDSQWPGQYDYDQQLRRKNQVPTCCVFKREIFERLGGYRQRYAPIGAGSEDAEFWTRVGAYGFHSKKVSEEPLFIYSMGTGTVSGNKDYREVDWLAWHPWAQNGQHPFASIATPKNGLSHPVTQYDEPLISVVIPVGPSHEKYLVDALDSLEAQDFRKWEAIVVLDFKENDKIKQLKNVYPYAKWEVSSKIGSGPGVARNCGAKMARGKLLFFMDADDYLLPGAFTRMIASYEVGGGIVYTDYYGQIKMEESERHERVLDYNPKTKLAIVRHYAAEYDCKRAQAQPVEGKLFHWCLVSCLIPKEFHERIGGFDEGMESFEDVDYHWRMSHQGFCYTRIREPMMVYRFETGTRRSKASPDQDESRQRAVKLLKYMQDKYKGVIMAKCLTCGQASVHPTIPESTRSILARSNVNMNIIEDKDVVEIEYTHPSMGEHRVIGQATKINYGYRTQGERFLVHRKDVEVAPHLYKVVVHPAPQKQSEPEPPAEETPIIEEMVMSKPQLSLQVLPGVTREIEEQLLELGVESYQDIVDLGVGGLMELKGVGEKRAESIMKAAEEKAYK